MAKLKSKPRRAGPFTLGAYVRQLREENALSLRKLSKLTGLSTSALCRLEQGAHVPVIQDDVDSLDKLWVVLGGDMNQMLYLSRRCPLCRGGGTLREWTE